MHWSLIVAAGCASLAADRTILAVGADAGDMEIAAGPVLLKQPKSKVKLRRQARSTPSHCDLNTGLSRRVVMCSPGYARGVPRISLRDPFR